MRKLIWVFITVLSMALVIGPSIALAQDNDQAQRTIMGETTDDTVEEFSFEDSAEGPIAGFDDDKPILDQQATTAPAVLDSDPLLLPDDGFEQDQSAPVAESSQTTSSEDSGCDFHDQVVGQSLTVARARLRHQGRPIRIIQPNSGPSLDYRSDRINLEIDEMKQVLHVFCG